MALTSQSLPAPNTADNSDLLRRYCPTLAADAHEQIAAHLVPDMQECWPWDGWCDKNGYGYVWCEPTPYGAPESVRVHRYMYERLVGPIPCGHDVHHRCEVKPCWNLFHLQALTPKEHKAAHRAPAPLWKRPQPRLAPPVVEELPVPVVEVLPVAEVLPAPARPRKRRVEGPRPRREHGGRPCTLTPAQQAFVLQVMQDLTTNVTELAEALGVHRSTIYRTQQRARKEVPRPDVPTP